MLQSICLLFSRIARHTHSLLSTFPVYCRFHLCYSGGRHLAPRTFYKDSLACACTLDAAYTTKVSFLSPSRHLFASYNRYLAQTAILSTGSKRKECRKQTSPDRKKSP